MKRDEGFDRGLPPEVIVNNFYVDVNEVHGKYVADSYVLKISAHNRHARPVGEIQLNGFYDVEYKRDVLRRRETILKVIGSDKDTVARISYMTLMLGLNFRQMSTGKKRLVYTGGVRSAIMEYLGSIRGESTVIPCRDIRGLRVPFGFPRRHATPWFYRLHSYYAARNPILKGECKICYGKSDNIHGFPNVSGRFYGKCAIHDLCMGLAILRSTYVEGVSSLPLVYNCGCGEDHTWKSDSVFYPVLCNARVVGDNTAGMYASLKKITRNAIVHNAPAALVMKGIALMFKQTGVTYSRFPLPVPDMFEPTNYMHDYPKTKGGALLMRKVHVKEQDGIYVGNFMNPYRTEAANTAAFISTGVAHFALEEALKGRRESIRVFNEAIITALKTAFKSEVKVGSDVPRTFQVASIFDLAIEKVIFTPLQKLFSGRFPFMVGFRWTHQGAHQVAEYMSYLQHDKYFWADYDISGLDVDLIASVVIAITCSLFGFFEIDVDRLCDEFRNHIQGIGDINTKKLVVFYIIYSKMVQNYSGKIITFPDFFRVIIGGMSSGQLNTSFFDTLYCIVMVYCWLLHCAAMVPINQRAKWVQQNIALFHFLIYGDDGLMRILRGSGLHVLESCNVEKRFPSYQKFLKEYFNLSIKVEESGEYERFLVRVTSLGEVEAPGPKILQRYFTWNSTYQVVAPLRVTTRALPRLLCDQSEFEDADAYRMQLLRIVGHMYDCAGTNFYYFNLLRMMHDSIVNVLMLNDESLEPDDASVKQKFTLVWESKIFQVIGRDHELAAQMIQAGSLIRFPTYAEIDQLFNESNIEQRHYDDVDDIMERIGYYETM